MGMLRAIAGVAEQSRFSSVQGILKCLAVVATSVVVPLPVAAGPVLVKDINNVPGGSNPYYLASNGSICYFTFGNSAANNVLWRSAGTEAGTQTVRNPALTPAFTQPRNIFHWNGWTYFVATQPASGFELYRTDGTSANTSLFKDIQTGTNSSNPAFFCVSGTKMYFQAFSSSTVGNELFVTDGTAVGTVLVKNINPVSGTLGSSSPREFMSAGGGLVYFRAAEPTTGDELWKSDGTAVGTVLVSDIYPGTTGSLLTALGHINGLAVFAANDGSAGTELWVSNGVTTTLLKDINPGAGSSSPSQAAVINGNQILFRADDGVNGPELWITDGTIGGTQLVKDLNAGAGGSNPRGITSLGLGNTAQFVFAAGTSASGDELWVTDGTAIGTVQVAEIAAASANGIPTDPFFTPGGSGKVYFFGKDSAGIEPWSTDGTAGGTALLKDINPGPPDSINITPNVSGFMTATPTHVYFSATNAINGQELWVSDGTEAGTVIPKEMLFGNAASNPSNFAELNNKLYFSATYPGSGTELFSTDGTEAGTTMVQEIYPGAFGSNPTQMTKSGSYLYYSAETFEEGIGTTGRELFRTDGSAAGTTMVKHIAGLDKSSNPARFTDLNGLMIFTARNSDTNVELWKSDGTEAGTTMLIDITQNPLTSSNPQLLTAMGSHVYFVPGLDPTYGSELWKTDGTPAGTVIVKDLAEGPDSGMDTAYANLTVFNGRLYFPAIDAVSGTELFSTDGTEAGTIIVGDANGSEGSTDPTMLCATTNYLFFKGYTDDAGYDLWRTDGTNAGTIPLKDVSPGAENDPDFMNMTAVGNRLFFTADTSDGHGAQLWVSDGSEAGTYQVKEINSISPAGAGIGLMTPYGNRVIFAANDGVTGSQIWVSDGTEAGTHSIPVVAPGSPAFSVTALKILGAQLLISGNAVTGDNTEYRHELWALPLIEAPVSLSSFELE